MVNLFLMAGVFLASFIMGYILISKIPSLLHTPLMSMTNAVSGITILGALLLFSMPSSPMETIAGAVAITSAAFNVVGGFAVTDRMLGLFKEKSSKSDS